MNWAACITRALDEDRFVLMRQAIVPIDGSHSDGHHYEILVRLKDADGQLIAPGAFIPAAERFGLMPALDRWVIGQTLKTLSGNPALREATSMCSINLSGLSLGDAGLLDFILEQLRKWQVPATMLCFEITETAVISDLSNTRRLIDNLQFHGCRFALDDFGSGLSSFSYLKELPVDYLKIDGNFVRNICNDPIDSSIVSSITQVGHVMGIRTIAEFVEDGPTLERLRAIGVNYGQGYGIQPPVGILSPDFPVSKQVAGADERAAV
jgi:EAL domain-containing protein (putative c-di-GMP-specific phosphodiesterase class I)